MGLIPRDELEKMLETLFSRLEEIKGWTKYAALNPRFDLLRQELHYVFALPLDLMRGEKSVDRDDLYIVLQQGVHTHTEKVFSQLAKLPSSMQDRIRDPQRALIRYKGFVLRSLTDLTETDLFLEGLIEDDNPPLTSENPRIIMVDGYNRRLRIMHSLDLEYPITNEVLQPICVTAAISRMVEWLTLSFKEIDLGEFKRMVIGSLPFREGYLPPTPTGEALNVGSVLQIADLFKQRIRTNNLVTRLAFTELRDLEEPSSRYDLLQRQLQQELDLPPAIASNLVQTLYILKISPTYAKEGMDYEFRRKATASSIEEVYRSLFANSDLKEAEAKALALSRRLIQEFDRDVPYVSAAFYDVTRKIDNEANRIEPDLARLKQEQDIDEFYAEFYRNNPDILRLKSLYQSLQPVIVHLKEKMAEADKSKGYDPASVRELERQQDREDSLTGRRS